MFLLLWPFILQLSILHACLERRGRGGRLLAFFRPEDARTVSRTAVLTLTFKEAHLLSRDRFGTHQQHTRDISTDSSNKKSMTNGIMSR